MSKVYAVYYRFYAESAEKRELQDLYSSLEKAKSHNQMDKEELSWAGITGVDIEEIEVIE